MGLTVDDGKLVLLIHELLYVGGMRATAKLLLSWPAERQLAYIAHMKRLAAEDSEKYHLFSDIIAEVTARQIGV